MAEILTERMIKVEGKPSRPAGQYVSYYGTQGAITHCNPKTGECKQHNLEGLYAPKRLKFLAENVPEFVREKLDKNELIKYALDFEDEMQGKVMDLFIAMKDGNADYKEAQTIGDFEFAAGLANNDMETAKQFIMREFVYVV